MNDERYIIPHILPVTEDGVFKTLLTHPDAKPVLCDVISSVLLITVSDAEIRSNELPISDIGQKRERFDINCMTSGEEQINVEMQSSAMNRDTVGNAHANLKNRAIFNLCDLHSSQPGRGIEYSKLQRTFQITFCDYIIFPDRKDFVNRFSFRNAQGDELVNSVGIVFIELPKLGEVLKKPIDDMTGIEIWSVFFAIADKPKYRELMDNLIAKREEIKLASHLLENISNDPKQVSNFLARRWLQMDIDHDRVSAFNAGKDEGKIEGRDEGRNENKIETAKNALAMNIPLEQIEILTGLSREIILNLRKTLEN